MGTERSIEVTAENVEDAIAQGLKQLGVEPHQVIVEVIEEPSRGILGLGSRQARVRLQLLTPSQPDQPRTAIVSEPYEYDDEEEDVDDGDYDDEDEDYEEDADSYDDDDYRDTDAGEVEARESVPEDQLDDEAKVARAVLNELLDRMEFDADIAIRQADPTRKGEAAPWLLDIGGLRDPESLIGRRGDTLASLQYITRLITSRELQRRANIIVDVEGYKSRRADRLRNLAERMAKQVIETQRMVTMEPMPPHERRIIHLTLRNHPEVDTRSVGEGNSRKVTIVPNDKS